MNNYRLICGDANKVIPRLAEEGVQVDMIFCSPNPLFFSLIKQGGKENTSNVGSEPRLTDYLDHLCVILAKCRGILKDTGSLWVHMMDTFMTPQGSMLQVPEKFALLMSSEKYAWLLRGKRVWLRGPHESTPGSTAAASLCPWDWEPIYWFVQQQEGYTFNKESQYAKTSVIVGAPYQVGMGGLPHQVMREAIELTTKPGDTVMDCFMSTGETGIVALDRGRKFIGIELSADKVALAQKRLRSMS